MAVVSWLAYAPGICVEQDDVRFISVHVAQFENGIAVVSFCGFLLRRRVDAEDIIGAGVDDDHLWLKPVPIIRILAVVGLRVDERDNVVGCRAIQRGASRCLQIHFGAQHAGHRCGIGKVGAVGTVILLVI